MKRRQQRTATTTTMTKMRRRSAVAAVLAAAGLAAYCSALVPPAPRSGIAASASIRSATLVEEDTAVATAPETETETVRPNGDFDDD
eukprot:CAMPEP_0197195488 /NCGR_PEP_ID=MMETSP1423-20130617/31242_1 /TAXON_ID=476441 /ORGANISM="Pseudo-nitzschia heimii, Strain UNC1101" /LENGTH=86 /DNA_ID=CAMNT_0042649139 /DNA_START=97 /DNA_END=354 /DNA_ORIENTATION=+